MENTAPKEPGTYYVDLDGTLAHYTGWKSPEDIGDPIPAMMDRVKAWLMEGKPVKIFTARFPEHHGFVREWLFRHGLGGIPVTNVKGIDGMEFWDDRAVPVEPNTGRVLDVRHIFGLAETSEEQRAAAMQTDDPLLHNTMANCGKYLEENKALRSELEAVRGVLGERDGKSLADRAEYAMRGWERDNTALIATRAELEVALSEKAETERQIREVIWLGEPGSILDSVKALWANLQTAQERVKEMEALMCGGENATKAVHKVYKENDALRFHVQELEQSREHLSQRSELRITGLEAEIKALKAEALQTDIETKDKAFYVEQFAAVSKELEAVKAQRDEQKRQRDETERQLNEETRERHELEEQLAALRSDTRAVKVRWDVTAEDLESHVLDCEKNSVRDRLQYAMHYLAAHAVIDVPAGVPSVPELANLLRKTMHNSDDYMSPEMKLIFEHGAAAIRDAVLVGILASSNSECEDCNALISERDAFEEQINQIASALELDESRASWSNLNDVGEECVKEAESLILQVNELKKANTAPVWTDAQIEALAKHLRHAYVSACVGGNAFKLGVDDSGYWAFIARAAVDFMRAPAPVRVDPDAWMTPLHLNHGHGNSTSMFENEEVAQLALFSAGQMCGQRFLSPTDAASMSLWLASYAAAHGCPVDLGGDRESLVNALIEAKRQRDLVASKLLSHGVSVCDLYAEGDNKPFGVRISPPVKIGIDWNPTQESEVVNG